MKGGWFKNRGLPSTAQARARVLSILRAHREVDVSVLATKAEVSLRRAAVIAEGLEREGVVRTHCPEPGVTIVRLTGAATHEPPIATVAPAPGGGRR
jgi:hypothetical protein